MNPHHLFIGIALVSIAFTASAVYSSGNTDSLLDMAKTLGITLAGVGVVLYVTRRYWQNARRLV